MELQGRQVRVMLSRSERDAEAHVHDSTQRVAIGKAGDHRADKSFPRR